jgi:hypothetical protein
MVKNIEKLRLIGWIMVFDATFNNMSVISCQLYWWRNSEYTETTIDLP